MKKGAILSSYILLIILSSTFVLAEANQFGITIDCLGGCKDKEIENSQDIMLVLTIKNNLNYWISLGEMAEHKGGDIVIEVENRNLKGGKKSTRYSDFFKETFIEPKSERKIYIPLKEYNELEAKDRLDKWTISPTLYPSKVKFYKNPFNSKENVPYSLSIPEEIKGNALEFTVITPEVEISKSSKLFIFSKEFWMNSWTITIVGGLVVGIILLFLRGRKKKR